MLTSEISTQELLSCADALRASSQSNSGDELLPQLDKGAIKIENFDPVSSISSGRETQSRNDQGKSRNPKLPQITQKNLTTHFDSTDVFNAAYLHQTDMPRDDSDSGEAERISRTDADMICQQILQRTFDKDCGEFCERIEKLKRMHSRGSLSVFSGSRSQGLSVQTQIK